MALVPTLTIKDTTTFSDDISFSVTDSLTVKAPSQSLTNVIAGTAGGDTILIAAGSTDTAYLFIRHTGTTDGSTGTAHQLDVENTDNIPFARMQANEWLFIPYANTLSSGKGVQLQTTSGSIQVEYAYWTNA